MSIYKFLDKDERLTKRDFSSFKEACDFAKANNLTCMTMTYQDFMTAFMEKVARFESHYNFSRLQEMANQAISANPNFGILAVSSNDFMRRIIEMPTPYIVDWLEGKNNLEWLPDYLSESECDHVDPYPRKAMQETAITPTLQTFLKEGSFGINLFSNNESDSLSYGSAIKYWSNSIGELHHHGEYDITEEELPEELRQAYHEIDCFEQYGSRVYFVETEKGYGIALINEYDECFAKDCNLSMDNLFMSAMVDAAAIRSLPEFESASIYLAKELGFESSHELAVVFPASISPKAFEKAAKLLDETVYKSAPELQRVAGVLNTNPLSLRINGYTLKALKKTSFDSIADLLCVSAEDLIKLPGWGRGAVEDVYRAVTNLSEERNVPNLRLWAQIQNVFGNHFETNKKLSLSEQIQSASIRTGDSHASPDVPVKSQDPER